MSFRPKFYPWQEESAVGKKIYKLGDRRKSVKQAGNKKLQKIGDLLFLEKKSKTNRLDGRKKSDITNNFKFRGTFNYSRIFQDQNRRSFNQQRGSKGYKKAPSSKRNTAYNQQSKRTKIRISGNQDLNRSGMSYFESRDHNKPEHVNVKINDGYFLLNGKKRSGGSLGRHLRKSSVDFEGGVRYSSVKRERRGTGDRLKKSKSKRSSSTSHTDLMSKMVKKKQRRKKIELDTKIYDMKKKYKGKDYRAAIAIGEKILEDYPKMPDALYFIGLSSSFIDDHQKAIENFEKLIFLDAKYEKIAYLFLTTAYKKMNDRDNGIRVLEKAIKHFPKYYDAYIYLGKLHLKARKLVDAIHHFSIAIDIDPLKLSGYIGLGDCYKFQGEFSTAIQNYSTVIKREKSFYEVIYLKRAKCYIELKEYDLADKDISKILDVNQQNCDAIYFRGLILMEKGDFNDAILNYEQAIKLNNSESATIRSLQNISLIKIKERDIYAAYYTLERIEHIPDSISCLSNLKIFLDGAVSMIKKKFEEGLESMEKLIDIKEIDETIKPLIISYRAYGNFSLGNIKQALDDYTTLEKQNQLNDGDEYNKYLCLGILQARDKQFDTALEYFTKAQEMDKTKIEPPFYIWLMSIIRLIWENREEYDEFIQDPNDDKKFSELKRKLVLVVYESLEHLEKVLAENDSCSNLSFYVGYLKLTIGLENEAVENFNTAIDKSDDNHAEHYIWKGIAMCMCNEYERAANEFEIGVSIDPKNFQAALYKLRCHLFNNDYHNANITFKRFDSDDEQEHLMRYWIGNYFFAHGIDPHADQLYLEALNLKTSEDCLKQLIKCCIAEKNLIKALEMLKKLNERFDNKKYIYDFLVLDSLKSTSSGEFEAGFGDFCAVIAKTYSGMVFSRLDVMFYKGFSLFYLEKYDEAIDIFNQVMREKYENHNYSHLEMEALRHIFQGETEEEDGPTVGQTFTKLELMYNIAICYIMASDYQKAIYAIEAMIDLGQKKKEIKIKPESLSAIESLKVFESLLEDKADIEAITFEAAIISLIKPSLEKIIKYLKLKPGDVIEKDEVNSLSEPASKRESENGDHNYVSIAVFPSTSRLCGIYEDVEHQLECGVTLVMKLSFCLPYIEPPDLTIKVGFEILKEIAITSVENRPEAPWIKRNCDGIVFTNNLIEKEAYEVNNVSELLDRISHSKQAVVNTRVKLNAEKIFENHKKAEDKKQMDKKNAYLLEIKQNLMLDMNTEKVLNNILKEEEE